MFLTIIFAQLSYIMMVIHKKNSQNFIRNFVSPVLFCNFVIMGYLILDLLNRYLELN